MRLSISMMLNTFELYCFCLVLWSLWSTSWVCPISSMFPLCLFLFFPLQGCFSEQRGWGGGYAPQQLVTLLQVLTVRQQKVWGLGMFSGCVNMVIWTQLWLLIFSESALWRHSIKQEAEPGRARVCWLWVPVWEQLRAGSLGGCFLLQTACVSSLFTSSRGTRGRTSFLLLPPALVLPPAQALSSPKNRKKKHPMLF